MALYTGTAGHDRFTGGWDPDTIRGGAGDDLLDGSRGNDLLDGGDDQDSLYGGMGDDTLTGGNGNDLLDGNVGNDLFNGGNGNDTVVAGHGDDRLFGEIGDDRLDAGYGFDLVEGGAGNDTVFGGEDGDTVRGGDGSDSIDGGAGADQIDGGLGNDTLFGGSGNDLILGGEGSDWLAGAGGNDTIDGGLGLNWASGGEGDDVYVFGQTAGDLTVTDFWGTGMAIGDRLDIRGIADAAGDRSFDTLIRNFTQVGANAVLQTATGTLTLQNVKVEALKADDFVLTPLPGTPGQHVVGSDGNDTLAGGAGADQIDGWGGSDVLIGRDGDDRLFGGFGDDTVSGGDGRDTAVFIGNRANYTVNSAGGYTSVWSHLGEGTDVLYGVEQLQFADGILELSGPAGQARIDFSGDGYADILFQNGTTGQLSVLEMNGHVVADSGPVLLNGTAATAPASSQLLAKADFTGDRRPDVLWRNTGDGTLTLWSFQGSTVQSASAVTAANGGPAAVSPNLSLQGTGDFNGDQVEDLVWRNTTTGALSVWEMNGATVANSYELKQNGATVALASNQRVEAVSDFSGDGLADLFIRATDTGRMSVLKAEGDGAAKLQNMTWGAAQGYLDPSWQVESTGSFLGGEGAELLIRNTRDGGLALLPVSYDIYGPATPGFHWLVDHGTYPKVPMSVQVEAVDDFDGNGSQDILWRNTTTGSTSIWDMFGQNIMDRNALVAAGAGSIGLGSIL